MLQLIFLIIAFGVLLVYATGKLKFELQMMQLNSYRNDRYFKWLTGNLFSRNRILEIILVCITGVLFLLKNIIVFSLACSVLYGCLAFVFLSRKQKKPVVFTKRAQRLFGTNCLIFFVLIFFSWILFKDAALLVLTGNLLLVFSFLIIMLANILVTPLEASINKWYYKDAQKILRQRQDLIIIGITGSYGKTSTKHFLYRLLSEKYNVLMTPGSYNTTLGVIRTIREQLKAVHQIFIVEMGAKQTGDIKEICDLVKPQIGILTAVGEQHLETFKTIKNVQKTKFELIDSLPDGSLSVLNADYEYVANKKVINKQTAYYSSFNATADYYIKDISYSGNGSDFSVYHKGKQLANFQTRLLGDYNLSNILAAYIVAKHLNVPDAAIGYAIKKLEPVNHRLEVRMNSNGVTVIDDAFNSNPLGSKMALDILKVINGSRKIIITPGMIELGAKQEYYNTLLGEQIADVCDYIILVGKKTTAPILKGLKNKNVPNDKIFVAQNLNDATNHLSGIVKAGDVLLYENDLPDTFE